MAPAETQKWWNCSKSLDSNIWPMQTGWNLKEKLVLAQLENQRLGHWQKYAILRVDFSAVLSSLKTRLKFDRFEQLKHPIRLIFCPDSEFATFLSKIKAILPKFAICIEDSTSFNSDDSDFYGFWLCWDSKMMKSPKIPWF